MTYYTKYSVGQNVTIHAINERRRIRGLSFVCMGTNFPIVQYYLDGYPDNKPFVDHELVADVYQRANSLERAFSC